MNILNVTVDFVSEVITCIRDKEKKLFQEIQKKLKKFMIHGFFRETQDLITLIGNWLTH